jgi:hypothetical protein
MNKREFMAAGMATVAPAPILAASPGAASQASPLGALLTRTRRLPDLVERAGADAFEAYVGERFTVVGGAGLGEQWAVARVTRVARCAATEQFTVAFAPAAPGPDPSRAEATRVLLHAATGQRVALHLEASGNGLSAHFNLLAAARSVPPDRRA